MSELDDAMEQHMAYIVLTIGRPFSFKDFLCFEVDGEEYKASHGPVRNKFNEFTEKEIIELDYKTNIAFSHFALNGRARAANFYGLTRRTSGIGLSGAEVAISRLKRRVVPSNVHPPSLQRELASIGFPSRILSAFAVASSPST